jgi:hypothetical protein
MYITAVAVRCLIAFPVEHNIMLTGNAITLTVNQEEFHLNTFFTEPIGYF